MKIKPNITAKDLIDELAQNAEYKTMIAERERSRAEAVARLMQEQIPVIEELAAAGRIVNSIDDLVNTAESYPEAIPILVKHLQLNYNPAIKESITRALSVKDARGMPAQVILAQLKSLKHVSNSDERGYRFALANALVTVGDSSMLKEVEVLLRDPSYSDIWIEVKRVLTASSKRGNPRR